MALESFMLEAIQGLTLPNNRVLCLGYPDIFCPSGDWPKVERAKDQSSIRAWHHSEDDVLDGGSWFKHLGMELECWDIAHVRGPEKIVDLNLPFHPDGWQPQPFGLVIDPGTTEHCFNIGQAWQTITESLAVGGVVMHVNPLNQSNHGFWNISPTAYCDFYEANGFKIIDGRIVCGSIAQRRFLIPPNSARFDAPENSSLFVMARKMRSADFMFPTQKKYRIHPNLKGAA